MTSRTADFIPRLAQLPAQQFLFATRLQLAPRGGIASLLLFALGPRAAPA
jgi:hypothetical protein